MFNKTFNKWIIAGVAALALAFTVLTIEMPWLTTEQPPSLAEGACPADAPAANLDFTLNDLEGRPVTLADYKGKVILLDLWATWCGPCKVEIPWFIEFQDNYGPAGLQIIGVSVDDPLDKLTPYVTAMKMNYTVVQGIGRDDLFNAYGPILALPITTLISRDGRICLKHTGLISKDALEQQIKALL